MLAHRADVIRIQTALEEAWRSAISECQALNRQLGSYRLPEGPKKQALLEAETKKLRIEALQQKAFLLFQSISENKYEEQITAGEEILTLPAEYPKKTFAEKTEAFLIKENTINSEMLQKFSATRRELKGLAEEAKAIRKLPCKLQPLCKYFDHDLGLLETFLGSTALLLEKNADSCSRGP